MIYYTKFKGGEIMAYYNRNGKAFKTNKEQMEYLTSGECASICHNDKIILKEYFSDTLINCRLDPKIFDILKDIDDEYFIKLIEIYSDMDLLELFQYKINIRKFLVDAYTAVYYKDDSVNVLYEPKNYLLESFLGLERLFGIFTDNSIVTENLKRKNAILSPSGIIIIDPDTFYKSTLPKEDIAIANKKELLTLLRSICISCIEKNENYESILGNIILDLADISIDNNTNITDELSKKLKYVKKPVEYLVKAKK